MHEPLYCFENASFVFEKTKDLVIKRELRMQWTRGKKQCIQAIQIQERLKELKELRECRKISLEEISERTKINVQYLIAIEEGNFNEMEIPYLRLFLRAYAEVIGGD